MPLTELAQVTDLTDDSELIATFFDTGESGIVEDPLGKANVADIINVDIESDDFQLIKVVKSGGWGTANSVAVVESVLDNKLVVRTENGQIAIDRPAENIDEGNTIALTNANSFRSKIDDEPVEINSNSDLEIDGVNINIGGEDDNKKKTDKYQSDNIGDVSFDDIVGQQIAKEQLFESVQLPLEKEEKMREFGLEGQFGILFYGPPGTGKTMMAKAAANEWGASDLFFHIGGPEIVSKYYGESERQIRYIFDAAEEKAEEEGKPAVVFIDELDSVVPRRDHADETERRIVAQFLSQLDGLEDRGDVVVIGATNLIEVIDPAVRRPGRFDEEIEFTRPSPEESIRMLEKHSAKMPVSPDVDFASLSNEIQGWSGADLESVVKKAGLIAVKDDRSNVHHEDFLIAIERFDKQRRKKENDMEEMRERQ